MCRNIGNVYLVIFKCDIFKMMADSWDGLDSRMDTKHIKFNMIIASWQQLRIAK